VTTVTYREVEVERSFKPRDARLRDRELADGTSYPADESEAIVQHLLRLGTDWHYVDCDKDALLRAYKLLDDDMAKRFSSAVEDFEAENETTYQSSQRVTGIFDRRVAQDEQRSGHCASLVVISCDPADRGRLQRL